MTRHLEITQRAQSFWDNPRAIDESGAVERMSPQPLVPLHWKHQDALNTEKLRYRNAQEVRGVTRAKAKARQWSNPYYIVATMKQHMAGIPTDEGDSARELGRLVRRIRTKLRRATRNTKLQIVCGVEWNLAGLNYHLNLIVDMPSKYSEGQVNDILKKCWLQSPFALPDWFCERCRDPSATEYYITKHNIDPSVFQ